MSAVVVSEVSKVFGTLQVLQEISLTVREGEVVSLVGPSGCGKTTLLRIIAGLEEPSSGQVRVNGDSPSQACRKHSIGIAFQHAALLKSLTSRENVALTLDIAGSGDGSLEPRQILSDFGLAGFLDHYPHQLSGGMQQRVNIACAVVHNPKVLLLDEPFGALDDLTRGNLWQWLGSVLAKTHQTVLFVTHNVEEAVFLSDRVGIFSPRPGRITKIFKISQARPRSYETLSKGDFLRRVADVRRVLMNRGLGSGGDKGHV